MNQVKTKEKQKMLVFIIKNHSNEAAESVDTAKARGVSIFKY